MGMFYSTLPITSLMSTSTAHFHILVLLGLNKKIQGQNICKNSMIMCEGSASHMKPKNKDFC